MMFGWFRKKRALSDAEQRAQEQGRGRDAEHPAAIPFRGWKDVLWRVYKEIDEDRVMLIAAGATYYLLLAMFPAMGAFVSLYGFVADPKTVADHISFLGGMLPTGSLDIIKTQLQALSNQDTESLSFGFLIGLGVALWSANNGIKSLFEAMNIAYGEHEKRSFIKLNAISLLFTLGAVMIGILFIVSVGVVPAAIALLRLDMFSEWIIRFGRWPIMFVAITGAILLLYRFGPSRAAARWSWLFYGAGLSTIVWLAASIGFSWYLENFADYNATYGALGAVIGLMVWMWISVTILIVGAELNAELEHQTARDSTTGAPAPLGARGAIMADTVGQSAS